jgi:hypothetical protein
MTGLPALDLARTVDYDLIVVGTRVVLEPEGPVRSWLENIFKAARLRTMGGSVRHACSRQWQSWLATRPSHFRATDREIDTGADAQMDGFVRALRRPNAAQRARACNACQYLSSGSITAMLRSIAGCGLVVLGVPSKPLTGGAYAHSRTRTPSYFSFELKAKDRPCHRRPSRSPFCAYPILIRPHSMMWAPSLLNVFLSDEPQSLLCWQALERSWQSVAEHRAGQTRLG